MNRPLLLLAAAFLGACGADCYEPGTACIVAGTGVPGFGDAGQIATETDLYWPTDVTVAPDGKTWIVDWNNHRIGYLQPGDKGDTFEVVSGGGLTGDGPLDGPVSTARWNHPTNILFRDNGYALIAAWHNSRVVAFDLDNDQVEHLAGNGARGWGGDGGPALDATLDLPSAVAYGPDGLIYFTDQANQRVRRLEADGTITTVVGDGERRHGGDGGDPLLASLNLEVSQNADPAGRLVIRGNTMLIADTLNHAVRIVDLEANTIDTLIGYGGTRDQGTAPDETGLYWPRDVAFGPDGEVFVADTQHNCIRRLKDGVVDTVLGICGETGYDDRNGPATEMLLDQPVGLDVGPDGTLWVADTWNHRIIRVEL